jgi:menaquinol-cytochrome c reductase iron-sulfur subunit
MPDEKAAAQEPEQQIPLPEQTPAEQTRTLAAEAETLRGELEDPQWLLSRRHLLMFISVAAGGIASAIVGLPILGFLLAPLFRKQPPVWRAVGPLSKFNVGETQKVTFEDSSAIPWGGSDSATAAWLRRVDERTFQAFAVDCTHLGCPVRWEASAELFMCPCHGGVYYKNGDVAAGPPPHALQQFPVRILNNTVEVEWRKLPAVAGVCPGELARTKQEVDA